MLFIIKLVQEEAFNSEIKGIKQCKEVRPKDKTNKLHKLNPFLDKHGVLRVGVRLTRSSLHPHVKHPVILPKTSHVSSLLIKHYHQKVGHQGRGITEKLTKIEWNVDHRLQQCNCLTHSQVHDVQKVQKKHKIQKWQICQKTGRKVLLHLNIVA